MNPWVFPSLIFGVALIACILSWWLGKCGGRAEMQTLEDKLRQAEIDLAAERAKGTRGDIAVSLAQPVRFKAKLLGDTPALESPKGRKRDGHGRFAKA